MQKHYIPITLRTLTKKYNLLIIMIFFLSHFFGGPLNAQTKTPETFTIKKILSLSWNGPITPATYHYLQSGMKKLSSDTAFLLTINTPGGLVSVTKDILTLFGESSAPVIVWVRPEGASATSAGALISAGAHVLFMSEGSNIGAATPIQMSGDIDKPNENQKKDQPPKKDSPTEVTGSDVRKKAVNDLVALVKALSSARGRNSEKFAEMVSNAASFEAREALKHNLIDGIANSRIDVESKLNQRQISIKGISTQLKVESPIWMDVEMSTGEQWLNFLAHPSLAYILFLIGAALLYFELQAPGGFIAGSLGVISLLLSGVGFQVLPINYAAFGLIIVSFILFILEIYVTSYGILFIAGTAALITGSLFIFDTPDAYLTLSKSIIFAAVGSIVVFFMLIMYVFFKDRQKKPIEGFNQQVGKTALVVKTLNSAEGKNWYQVKVGGEIWKAASHKEYSIGTQIKVIAHSQEGLHLILQDEEPTV